MKFKSKTNFTYKGSPVSLKGNKIQFFDENGWIENKIYEGKYYDGGVICPIPAYLIMSESEGEYLFTLTEAKPTYELFSDHFDIIEE